MLFTYKAVTPAGRRMQGQMDATNLIDLEMRLKRMELDFINGQPVTHGNLAWGATVPRRELINFCFHLEQLTRAGVPLLEGLTDLRASVDHPRFREVVASLIESIEGGHTLSQALAEHPRVFNGVFCSLIRAGENSGNLTKVLQSLTESLKWEDELASHTKKLIMYPMLAGVIILGVTLFLMIYLVPKMAVFIRSMGQELPLQTKILIAVSDFLVNYWYVLPILILTVFIGIRTLINVNPRARLRFDEFKLEVPLIGPILRKIILSRFAAVFAMLYTSGIAIIEAVRATEDVVGNRSVQAGLARATELISEGQNVTTAFQNAGLFPPLVIRMLRVGENTGALDTALLNVSYFYNRDVKESIEKAQAVIGPALTVVMGLLLLAVMMSVLGPIYDIITKIKT